jgi:hypothetical protein
MTLECFLYVFCFQNPVFEVCDTVTHGIPWDMRPHCWEVKQNSTGLSRSRMSTPVIKSQFSSFTLFSFYLSPNTLLHHIGNAEHHSQDFYIYETGQKARMCVLQMWAHTKWGLDAFPPVHHCHKSTVAISSGISYPTASIPVLMSTRSQPGTCFFLGHSQVSRISLPSDTSWGVGSASISMDSEVNSSFSLWCPQGAPSMLHF